MDKLKDNVFCNVQNKMIECQQEVRLLNENDVDLLNSTYKEINEEFGFDTTMRLYQMYRGTQVNFPKRFLNPKLVKKRIVEEFDGTNLKQLAVKYSYSEKTLRRIIQESVE